MAEPIQIEVRTDDIPAQAPVIETPPAPVQAQAPPPPAAPHEPPPYDVQRLEKDIAFYQRTGADKVVAEKLGLVPASAIAEVNVEFAVRDALIDYAGILTRDDISLFRGKTPEETKANAERLARRLQAQTAGNQPPPPPEIKLPERQYTPQEATLARAQYDLEHAPDMLQLKRDLGIH